MVMLIFFEGGRKELHLTFLLPNPSSSTIVHLDPSILPPFASATKTINTLKRFTPVRARLGGPCTWFAFILILFFFWFGPSLD